MDELIIKMSCCNIEPCFQEMKQSIENNEVIVDYQIKKQIRVNQSTKQIKKTEVNNKMDNFKYSLIDVSYINELPIDYPDEFKKFCVENDLNPPNINSNNGKALSVMLTYRFHYWNRDTCNQFVEKFKIDTKDSIQLFNKHSQRGIQTNSGTERGKLYIVYPYCLSTKHKMRKNFKFNGTDEEKNIEIDKIKSTIKADYVDVPNQHWQLGHKNPGSTDNTSDNLVLQPPIQAKYRDNYIFIDTLTKFPAPNKLKDIVNNNEIEFTKEQIKSYKEIFDNLFTSI